MSVLFPLYITYSQLVIFSENVKKPFNDWTDQHVQQGFSWREESVSFGIPEGGECIIEILIDSSNTQITGSSTRTINVPFRATSENSIAATIGEEQSFQLSLGNYQLTFELVPNVKIEELEYDYGVRLIFNLTDTPEFRLIKRDAEMKIEGKLIKTAEPAK